MTDDLNPTDLARFNRRVSSVTINVVAGAVEFMGARLRGIAATISPVVELWPGGPTVAFATQMHVVELNMN